MAKIYTVAYFKEQLNNFLGNNPNSKIVRKKRGILLEDPWEDGTISIRLHGKYVPQLIDTLNSLVLPPRFSAIFHIDTNIVEFIWSAIPNDDEIISRSFNFNFNGRNYKCYYAQTSDRLKLLATHSLRRVWYSPYEHRNILSLRQYFRNRKEDPDQVEDLTPISFFIEGFNSYDETSLLEISKNLNFNMLYFDRKSPSIDIHPLTSSPENATEPIQYINESFPNIIVSKPKDPLLLDLSSEAEQSDERMSYLYYYQIIERAAHFYLGDSTKSKLNKLLNSPDIQNNTDIYIERITETVLEEARAKDEVKIAKVTKSLCVPQNLWKEISSNIAFFSKPTSFDGGFTANPVIQEDSDYDNFCSCWHPPLVDQIRYIRNALVHSREKTSGSAISPTRYNDQLLLPWVTIIRRIAEDIILYSKID
ncbi:MAG: hypothetical protein V3U19_07670 [Thermodesulfobacteriota bacterium]